MFSISLYGIEKDSLWSVWNDTSLQDTCRLNAMCDLSWYLIFRDTDSAFVLCNMFYDLASESGNSKMQAIALKHLGVNCDIKGVSDSAIFYFKQGLDISEPNGYMMITSDIYHNMGLVYRDSGALDDALEMNNKALEIRKQINLPKRIIFSYRSLSTVYLEKDDVPRALEYLHKALMLSEETGDLYSLAVVNHTIGLAYLNMGEPYTARDYLLDSKEVFEELGKIRRLSSNFNNLGIVYKDLGKNDSALYSYNEGLKLAKQMKSLNREASFNLNIGNIHKINGDFNLAYAYYQDALEYFEDRGRHKEIASLYFNIGALHNKFDKFSTGKRWCDKALALADEYDFLEEQKFACECLRDAHEGLGNMTLAFQYQRSYYLIRDSLDRVRNNKEVTRLEIKYEYEKQHLADSLAMEEEKLKQELIYQQDLNKERTQRNAVILFGVGILIFAIFLYLRLLWTRKTNKKLDEKNKIIEREKQRAEESERSKEQFFNNISHEFKTPLTLIMGPLDKLISSSQTPKNKNELNIMKRNANRLYFMINELLNLYKLEAGKIKLSAKKQDIGQFTYRYIQSFESLARDKNIKLSFKADSELHEVYFEGDKIEKILSNLLSNAFKFIGDEGRVDVIIETVSEQTDGEREGVLITVEDNGIGIPKDDIDHIFDRFYQVDESLSHNYEGTGIGLALTKELVELHHGWIKVESPPAGVSVQEGENGKGAKFSFFIPSGNKHLAKEEIDASDSEFILRPFSDDIESEKDAEFPDSEVKGKDAPLLLVVEDNPDMRSYIMSDLVDNYKLIEAGNGQEGFEKAVEKIPDLIISDIMMPKMNGNEMCTKIKADERTSHIPVILVTARSAIEQKLEGLETGADAYLSKPFNSRELQIRIKNLISQREKLRERFSENLDNAIKLADSDITSMDQQFLEKALKVVEENMSDQDFSVEFFGREMAMSRVQLHRKLKALTDQSASKFIRTIRLKHAAEFLAKDGANVSDTAYKFGFSNLSYFAKCFSEDYGMTPKEYTARHNRGGK